MNEGNLKIALERSSNEQLVAIMDTMKMPIKPILTEEQWTHLNEFDVHARQQWRKHQEHD